VKRQALRRLKLAFQLGIPLLRAVFTRTRAKQGDEIAANQELIQATLDAADRAAEARRK
jgi:hypothetical protein